MSTAPDEPAPYRPLSIAAIAGMALAVLFVVVLSNAAVWAWWNAVPLQLPGVVLLLPVGAVAFSLAGRLQIARSEGTRAGLPLTSWGLGLSVVPALLFLTYSGVKDFAVAQEATTFTDDWFARLRQADASPPERLTAFWDALPRDLRAAPLDLDNPETRLALGTDPKRAAAAEELAARLYSFGDLGQKGALPLYQEHPLVRFVRGLPEEARIRPRGRPSWEYNAKARGYVVEQAYQITTPEGSFDATVAVMGSQGKSSPERDWQVLLERTGVSVPTLPALTPAGRLLMELRLESLTFTQQWVALLAERNWREAYRRTLPADQRDRADQLLRAEPPTRAAGLAELSGGLDLAAVLGSLPRLGEEDAARLFLPNFAEFRAGRLVAGRPRASRPDIRAAAFDDARQWFRGSAGPFPQLVRPSNPLAIRWQIEGEQLVIEHSFSVQKMPSYACDGVFRVATDDPAIVAALKSPGVNPMPPLDPQRSAQRRA